jgi:2-keto-4-pentenoate hydratase/2-oxohepta-3-ene-1,7-dioic acid hydratase in catechol pathway
MKLASVILDGTPTFGVVTDTGFVDLAARLQGRCADLRELFARNLVQEAAQIAQRSEAVALERIRFLRPIPNLDARMFALGWSYADHQLETGKEAPQHPFIFSKHPQAMVGHGELLRRPRGSVRFDFEGEIVIVIGKAGHHIPPEQAMEHVAGYTIMMDGSVRDWQQHSVTAGKNFDDSSAYGPWIVTPDAVPPAGEMALTTRLNGTRVQHSTFDRMAWGVAELVTYHSTICRLEPGDAISTGTPAGVGNKRTPPLYMKAGDVVEVEVTGIGVLRNEVADEA